jgi:hypothetical protein
MGPAATVLVLVMLLATLAGIALIVRRAVREGRR